MVKRSKFLLSVMVFIVFTAVNYNSLFAVEKKDISYDKDYSGIYESLKTKIILIKQKDKYVGKIFIKSKSYPLVAYNKDGFLKGTYSYANQIQFAAKIEDKIMVFESDLMRDYLNFKRGGNFEGIYKSSKILINLKNETRKNSISGFLEYNDTKFDITGSVRGRLLYGQFYSKDNRFDYYMILNDNKLTFYTGGFSAITIKMNSGIDELKSLVHYQPLGMKFVYVTPGTFEMGSDSGPLNERPQHQVTLTNPYLISQFVVTQSIYDSIMDSGLSDFDIYENNFPVINVSWNDAINFCKKLTEYVREKYDIPMEFEYTLPTEAEWEFAAKGGVISSGYKYSGSDNLDSVAWYRTNSGEKMHNIALKQPNELGIYDMSGNVLEWCQDWYFRYSARKAVNPSGMRYGKYKVVRGGGYINNELFCRTSSRSWDLPNSKYDNVGFRVVLMQKETPVKR
jgi:formylglycine-generating enzyme